MRKESAVFCSTGRPVSCPAQCNSILWVVGCPALTTHPRLAEILQHHRCRLQVSRKLSQRCSRSQAVATEAVRCNRVPKERRDRVYRSAKVFASMEAQAHHGDVHGAWHRALSTGHERSITLPHSSDPSSLSRQARGERSFSMDQSSCTSSEVLAESPPAGTWMRS